ncbi:hypothetical protein DdX_00825 [Ditylenchus destructor]|uniref:MD-2-related lipid-recognition domain-containing protein n=1 Tax=Ditylenchus destructor TaxID=166010 RepID=A0AAD4R7L5_9BILA|nr:hypothetical protein DdX_00825 [Ditylenchus destructor]
MRADHSTLFDFTRSSYHKNVVLLITVWLSTWVLPNSAAAPTPCECEDYKNNLVVAASDSKHHTEATIKNLSGVLYTESMRPSCSNGRPSVMLPGVTVLLGGELKVPKKYDLVKSGIIRMTVKSPHFKDPLCLKGVSQYVAMPDKFCSWNLCEFIGNDICEFLQTPGTHTIKEMEEKINFNTTLILPEPPSLLGVSLLDLFSGEFWFQFSLETEGKVILELDIPTNDKYLQIGIGGEESEDYKDS